MRARTVLGCLLVCGALAEPAAARIGAPAAPLVTCERPESDLLLLAVRLDAALLAESLPAFTSSTGDTLLPLGSLCHLVGLAIEVDARQAIARGYCLEPRRRFELDLRARRLVVNDRSVAFDPSGVEPHQDDLYVATRLLRTWLPIDPRVDPHAALLRVVPLEPLPMQLRLERRKQIEKALARLQNSSTDYRSMPLPYHAFDAPFVDQTLTLTSRPDPGGTRRNEELHSIYASGDLLYMDSILRVLGDDRDPFSEVRFGLGRKDPNGRLLGPLHAREVGFGDVFYPGAELISLAQPGNGFTIGNAALQSPTQWDTHTFRGELPPDWEVELYRDDALIGYQRDRTDGTYAFENVPLPFGASTFRLMFYGPQGERREEEHRFDIDASCVQPGHLRYLFTANAPREFARRGLGQLDWGAGSHLATSLAWAATGAPGGDRHYGKFGLRGTWGWVGIDAQTVAERNGGQAFAAGVRARRNSAGIQAQHVELRGFTSEALRPQWGPERSRTTANAYARLPLWPLAAIPVDVALRQSRLLSGQDIYEIAGRASTAWHRLYWSHGVQSQFGRGTPRLVQPRTTGVLLSSWHGNHFALRNELDYELQPNRRLGNVGLTLEGGALARYRAGIGVERSLVTAQTRCVLTLRKVDGAFGLGIRAELTPRQNAVLGLTLTSGLSRDPRHGRWHSQARSVASSGAVSSAVFLDRNANSRLDAGEEAVDDVGFSVNGSNRSRRTAGDGTVLLGSLTSYQESRIGLVSAHLEDPSWRPAWPGVRLIPRPGKTACIDFPIWIFGEITGTVSVRRGRAEQGLADIQLELVSQPDSVVIQRATTAYDGYFDLAGVRPGHYRLRLSEPQLTRLQLANPVPRQLEILPSGTILDGVSFVLRPVEAARPIAMRTGLREPRKSSTPALPRRKPARADRQTQIP